MRCVWFREDLRVEDQLALNYAMRLGQVWGLFLITPGWWERHGWGPNKIAALLTALQALADDLKRYNIPLIIKSVEGASSQDQVQAVLQALDRFQTKEVYLNRQYEIHETQRDLLLLKRLQEKGGKVHAYDDQLLFSPGLIRTATGQPFTVFTPFKNKALSLLDRKIALAPSPQQQKVLDIVSDLSALKTVAPLSKLDQLPITPNQAAKRLDWFLQHGVEHYHEQRDCPAKDGTSKLSVALSLGTLSPRILWEAVQRVEPSRGQEVYQSELLWREFYKHILIDFPHICRDQPFKKQYQHFNWNKNDEHLQAWKEGRTGYPIVDAGMRQLRAEGWMHNRLRMMCAMFLSKLLLLSWQDGEKEFAYWLADYDFSANNGGWQWSSSTGTDSVPYFRIFSPWSQSERFDPDGVYVKQYVPELRGLTGQQLSDPKLLARAAPKNYPSMIVDYTQARHKCLEAFKGV